MRHRLRISCRRAAWALGFASLLLAAGGCTEGALEFGGVGAAAPDTDVLDDGQTGRADSTSADRPGPVADPGLADVVVDVAAPDALVADLAVDDLAVEIDTGEPQSHFGAPCESSADCPEGFCVPGPGGPVCTRSCVETCPDGWRCSLLELAGQDATFVCLSRVTALCRPCDGHEQCRGLSGDSAARCIPFGSEEGSYCAIACGEGDPCPAGYRCDDVINPATGGVASQCLPEAGVCACNGLAIDDGASTDCSRGDCQGRRRCTADGLTACDAATPTDELCDDADNDCDGLTDEDFRTDGQYLHVDHCGSCGASCEGTLAGATAACGVIDGLPRCVVERCDDGFQQVAPDRCAPSGARQCLPCRSFQDCPAWLDCVAVGAGRFCLQACDESQGCPRGFACAPDGAELAGRCLLVEGGCGFAGKACAAAGDCEDLDPCTVEACEDAECVIVARDCNDAQPCTIDDCDPAAGGCVHEAAPDGLPCNDEDGCTAIGACEAGRCRAGAVDTCDDSLECTTDSCRSIGTDERECRHALQPGRCLIDGVCFAAGAAAPGAPCQVCDPARDARAWSPRADASACDDGSFCTVDDRCRAGVCRGESSRDCGAGDAPCQRGVCDEVADVCRTEPLPDGADCEDGTYCTVGDRCRGGACAAGEARDCTALDGACQTGRCDEAAGSCQADRAADGSPCEDGLRCTAGDACQRGVCTSGPPLDCSSSATACADGVCDPTTGQCDGAAKDDGTPCDDGRFCSIGDRCMAGDCEAGPELDCAALDSACRVGTCSDDERRCVAAPRPDGVACEDGRFCTVDDQCVAGACVSGEPRDCDPGAGPCIVGVCDDAGDGACRTEREPDGTFCDADMDPCTVGDRCLEGACLPGDAPDCDDGFDCTADACEARIDGGFDCTHEVIEGWCLIDGQCRRDGDLDPADDCAACRSALAPRGWTSLDDGASCNDGDPCTLDYACGGGLCAGTPGAGECAPDQVGEEPCGLCGTRTRSCGGTCAWGEWSLCTGEGVCSPGAEQEEFESCGACGQRRRTRTCTGGCLWSEWSLWGPCDGEGVCTPDAVDEESQSCGACGSQTRSRTCTPTCTWGAYGEWSTCGGEGVCSPGVVDQQDQDCGNCGSQSRSRTCTDACTWDTFSDWSACSGEGTCAPGAVDQQSQGCGDCGSQTRTRTCDDTCTWGGFSGWSACGGEGVCSPGAVDQQSRGCGNCGNQSRSRTCSGACSWGGFSGWSTCSGQGVCSPGQVSGSGCDACASKVCRNNCTWGGCSLNFGAECEWRNGTHFRCCGTRRWQFCLPPSYGCVWSSDCDACSGCCP